MARWLVLGFLCSFGLVVFGVKPALAAPAANRHLQKAKKALDSLDYARMTPLLQKALKTPRTAEEEIEIYVLLGTVHAVYSRDRQASEAFVEVLKRKPDFELPEDSSPKLRAALKEAQSQINKTSGDQTVVKDSTGGGGPLPPEASPEPPLLQAGASESSGQPEGQIESQVKVPPYQVGGENSSKTEPNWLDPNNSVGLDTTASPSRPIYTKVWFWAAVGGAAAIVAGGILTWQLMAYPKAPNYDLGPVVLK